MTEKAAKKTKVTLRSLAAELGIAPATVMRALNNHPNVTQGIRRKVVTLAMKRNYQLPERHAKHVAIVISPSSIDGYISQILNALSSELISRGIGFEIILGSNISSLYEHSCSGVISTVWESGLEKFWPTEHNLPLVVLNAVPNFLEGIYHVCSDERQGVNMAMEYLFSKGKRKIAMVSTPLKKNHTACERVESFHTFCREHQLAECFHEEHTVNNPLEKIAETIVKRRPEAVFVACETYVFAMLHYLQQAGIDIPGEMSLLSLEMSPYSAFAFPPLTTISQNFEMLAFHTVETLVQRIRKLSCKQQIVVPYLFHERKSV